MQPHEFDAKTMGAAAAMEMDEPFGDTVVMPHAGRWERRADTRVRESDTAALPRLPAQAAPSSAVAGECGVAADRRRESAPADP